MDYWKMWFIWLLLYLKTAAENIIIDEDDYDEYTISGDHAGEDQLIAIPWRDEQLVIQTMDGKLHVVDLTTGDVKWHVELNDNWFPKTQADSDEAQNVVFLPGPYDGSLYTYAKGHLSKLPLTIPQMVERSPSRDKSSDAVYIGDKKDSMLVLDRATGQVKRKITNHVVSDFIEPFDKDYSDIYVGYTDYTLAIFDSNTNQLKWNLTYSELRATESVANFDHQIDIQGMD
jgi:serine/threonine-protein kinase/endoribonuclease IRE1